MNKNKKIIAVLAGAVVAIVISIILIYTFISPHRTTMYVFKENYSAGTKITAEMFTPIQVDSTIIAAGGKANMAQRFITDREFKEILKTGDSLKMDVGEGTPLMMALLSVTGGNSIEIAMNPSAVAVTVDVDNVTGITQELNAESRVNVYVAYRSTGTHLLLENMRVLSVDKSENGSLKSATLEVNNDEALKLIEAQNNGSIHLGLVATGYQFVDEATGK